MGSQGSAPHIVLFPFMAKGHTIPLIHLSHLLFKRGLAITIFTTPANSPFIRSSLGSTKATVTELPFPENDVGIPPGVESTDQLTSMSLFFPFIHTTKLLQPHFEQAIESLPRVSCIITDVFHTWTEQSASRMNVPRIVFYGFSNYATIVSTVQSRDRPYKDVKSSDEPFSLEPLNGITFTKKDLGLPLDGPDSDGPFFNFLVEQRVSMSQSQGVIVNSFYELEPVFTDIWNKKIGPTAYCVGPLCLAEPSQADTVKKYKWQEWLDQGDEPVLYVAFGTQADVSKEQLREIGIGLERSGVCFMWVVRSKDAVLEDGFEERVAVGGRGLVVREWVSQREVLGHERVKGFMSHCGWGSVIESVCAGVPVLAWPLMAEQGINAKMIEEELGIGLKSGGGYGSELVESTRIEEMVRELMVGEKGKVMKDRAKELGEAARRAMEDGGSSCRMLDLFIQDVCNWKARENGEIAAGSTRVD